jgi:hypothetical protein
MSSGDFVRESTKTSFIEQKKEEPMRMIEIQEKQDSDKSHIIEIYAIILSIVSFLLGFCLKVSLSALDFFANVSRTLMMMCIDDLWSGSNEPFLLTYDNFKAFIIKTTFDLNARKVLLLTGMFTCGINYVISKLLFQIVKFLLLRVPVPE